jgi:hypothetical protein
LTPPAFERPQFGRSKAWKIKSFLVTFFQKSNSLLERRTASKRHNQRFFALGEAHGVNIFAATDSYGVKESQRSAGQAAFRQK